MIKEFVDKWFSGGRDKYREFISKSLENGEYLSYEQLVDCVIRSIDDDRLDPERVTVIDDGDYQGTQLYIIGEKGYQPSCYYSVFVDYGSCSGCDSLQATMDCSGLKEKKEDLELMGLHILQSISEIGVSNDEQSN